MSIYQKLAAVRTSLGNGERTPEQVSKLIDEGHILILTSVQQFTSELYPDGTDDFPARQKAAVRCTFKLICPVDGSCVEVESQGEAATKDIANIQREAVNNAWYRLLPVLFGPYPVTPPTEPQLAYIPLDNTSSVTGPPTETVTPRQKAVILDKDGAGVDIAKQIKIAKSVQRINELMGWIASSPDEYAWEDWSPDLHDKALRLGMAYDEQAQQYTLSDQAGPPASITDVAENVPVPKTQKKPPFEVPSDRDGKPLEIDKLIRKVDDLSKANACVVWLDRIEAQGYMIDRHYRDLHERAIGELHLQWNSQTRQYTGSRSAETAST